MPSLDDQIQKAIGGESYSAEGIAELVATFFDRSPIDYPDSLKEYFNSTMEFWVSQIGLDKPAPILSMLAILDPTSGEFPDPDLLKQLLEMLGAEQDLDNHDLLDVGIFTLTHPVRRPCQEVQDLEGVANEIASAIDPNAPMPLVVIRVLSLIDGLADPPLAPPELCPDLDLPAWTILRDHAPDWLLPGAEQLDADRVVAVATNPTFVEAYLLGLNTQALSELRFRNIPIVSGCTPLRQFWARTDPTAETYLDDIIGVRNWPSDSELGSSAHQPPAAAEADLVIVFKSSLFRRFPRTLVYLAPPPGNGELDWEADPDYENRIFPVFQGSITPDITFFGFNLNPTLGSDYWVVLEEPPHGVQFFNTPASLVDENGDPNVPLQQRFISATNGADFADAAFADPFRVLIRGSALVPGGS